MGEFNNFSARPVVGLLLAAGRGQRFGSDKRWHRLEDGVPMVVASARNLRRALGDCVAVVRADDSLLARCLRAEGLAIAVCDDAYAGMGASLARGVRASHDADGWLVALGDMPWIRPATIRAVAAQLARGASAVVPVHAGRRGHPVGFGACHRDALLALDGECGGRAILARHADRVERLAVDDPGVLLDLDRAQAAQAAV